MMNTRPVARGAAQVLEDPSCLAALPYRAAEAHSVDQ